MERPAGVVRIAGHGAYRVDWQARSAEWGKGWPGEDRHGLGLAMPVVAERERYLHRATGHANPEPDEVACGTCPEACGSRLHGLRVLSGRLPRRRIRFATQEDECPPQLRSMVA